MTINLAQYAKPCDSIVSLSEQGKTFKLYNASAFAQVQLDGEVIPAGQGPKCCDYYLYDHDLTELFVELKGRQIEDGLKQLLSSIQLFKRNFPNKYAFIVSSKVPPASSTKRQQAESKMARSGVKLHIKNSPAHYEYLTNGTIKRK